MAEQLLALSNNGLQSTDDPYQIERYEKILKLSARLLSLVDTRPLPEIERILFDDIDMKTPLAVADTGVFDDDGRLLLMSGRATKIGRCPAARATLVNRQQRGQESVGGERLPGAHDRARRRL